MDNDKTAETWKLGLRSLTDWPYWAICSQMSFEYHWPSRWMSNTKVCESTRKKIAYGSMVSMAGSIRIPGSSSRMSSKVTKARFDHTYVSTYIVQHIWAFFKVFFHNFALHHNMDNDKTAEIWKLDLKFLTNWPY